MRNKDNRQTVSNRQSKGREQVVCFLRGQNGSGFVKDQDFHIPVQRLKDFNPLAFTDRQATHPRRGLNHQIKNI